MATYFYIRDNILIREKVVKAPAGSQILYDVIEEVVGNKTASNGIPYAIEVDGWGELASIGGFTKPKMESSSLRQYPKRNTMNFRHSSCKGK